MQYLDNDMEDLFKRAGENYSPQKGPGDWDYIFKKIAITTVSTETAPLFFKRKHNSKIIALTGLFLLSVCWLLFQMCRNKLYPANYYAGGAASKNINAVDSLKNGIIKVTTEEKLHYNYNRSLTPLPATISKHFDFTKPGEPAGANLFKNEEVTYYRINYNNQLPLLSNFKKCSGEKIKEVLPNSTITFAEENVTTKKCKAAVIINKQSTTKRGNGMYIGLVAGADFSKVLTMPFNNIGFSAGAVSGYRLNKKVSFESGIILNKKIYKSEGKNFNNAKILSGMPAGMLLNSLRSKSSLIEVPLKIKYNFINNRNSDFFVTGGTSCYIVTREKNEYDVIMNGIGEKILATYKKNIYRIPAVATISIGYETSLSKNIDIRIEPFFKTPLQGIGVGSSPVTSAGLQIGFTSRLK